MKAINKVKYPFAHFDAVIDKTISFREVTLERDLPMLHSWMQEDHVIPYWQLNKSIDDYEDHLRTFLKDDHQKLLIGELDGIPVSYWEAYWVSGDIIGRFYPFHQDDQGIHLLIGPKHYLGKGLIYPLLLTILHHLFQHSETKRIVAEPDIRNKKMIHVFKKCGFHELKKVQLPDKTGLLLACAREDFERRWTEWQQKNF